MLSNSQGFEAYLYLCDMADQGRIGVAGKFASKYPVAVISAEVVPNLVSDAPSTILLQYLIFCRPCSAEVSGLLNVT